LPDFLATASPDWGFKTITFYGIGLLSLCIVPILEDQYFITGFTPLGTCHLTPPLRPVRCDDPAGGYNTAGIAPGFFEACNPPCLVLLGLSYRQDSHWGGVGGAKHVKFSVELINIPRQ
jgi:hypothetical protein